MGHQLDDFFKKKLGEREFEFDEAHWADALDLIEAEDKKDRKGFFFWLFGLAAVFTLIAFFAIQKYKLSADTSIAQNTTESTTNIKKSETQTTSSTSGTKQLDKDNFDTSTNRSNDKKLQTELPQKGNSVATTKPSTTENLNFDTPTSANTGATISTQNRNEWIMKKEEVAASPNPYTEATAISSTSTSDILTTVTKTEPKETLTNMQEASHKPNQLKELAPNESLTTLGIQQMTISKDLTDEDLDKTMKGELLKPLKRYSFSAGLQASTVMMSIPDGKMGLTAGLTSKHRFHPQWALGVDVLYHLRRHQFNDLNRSFQVAYAFGRIDQSVQLRPSAIHSFEFPIYIEYGFGSKQKEPFDFTTRERYNKHSIELGLAPVFLYGVQGTLVNVIDAGEEQVLEQGWIRTEAYRKLYANALLGYNHYVKDYFSLGIRARYAIGGIVDPSFEFFDESTVSQPDNFYFDINAKFYLF